MEETKESFSLGDKQQLAPKDFVTRLVVKAAQRVNEGVSKTLTARLSSERPPNDPRHLTDTRTRVSTLLEYSLAYEINEILEADKNGWSASLVLWNVFPDLIVRNNRRENVLGLEIKALHTAAEEKSANFMTPIQVIRRARDFIVIISWGWQISKEGDVSITYPHIHESWVFDAWVLAKIRDYGWLAKQRGRVKGIDLATPIISANSADRFKAEELNLGKLLRIEMPLNAPETIIGHTEMKAESTAYANFKRRVIALGLRETFFDLCLLAGANEVNVTAPDGYPEGCAVLGTATYGHQERIAFVAGAQPDRWLREAGNAQDRSVCFWLSKKLEWKVFRKQGNAWRVTAAGQKPDSNYDAISTALGLTLSRG